MNAADFLGLLFLARDVAHSAHWEARSYARHAALREFYTALPALIDDFAIVYQGKNGLIGPVNLAKPEETTNVVQFLEQQLAIIETNRALICGPDHGELAAPVDAICHQFLRTIYQLKFVG